MASPIAALRRETRPMEDPRAASALWRRPPAGSTGGPAPPLAYSAASRRADANNSGFIAKFHVKVIKLGQNIIWKSLFLLDVRLFRALGPAAALRCIRCIRCTCRLVPHAVWRGQGDAACRYCGTGVGLIFHDRKDHPRCISTSPGDARIMSASRPHWRRRPRARRSAASPPGCQIRAALSCSHMRRVNLEHH